MKKRIYLRLSLIAQLAFMFLVLSSPVDSQTGAIAPARGAKLGNSYSVGEFDTINTTTGNLMLNFPLASLPSGRGSATAGYSLRYNSKLYDMRTEQRADQLHDLTYYPRTVIDWGNRGGWTRSFGTYSIETESRPHSGVCTEPGSEVNQQIVYSIKVKIVFPDGSSHEMVPLGHQDALGDRYFKVHMDGTVNSCTGFPPPVARPVYYSRDGSFLRLETQSYTSWTLYFKDGSKVVNGDQIYDKNGNYVTGMLDQFGRGISHTYSGGNEYVTYKGVDGEDVTWTIKWKTIYVFKTYEACDSNHTHCHNDGTFGAYPRDYLQLSHGVVDEIIQPAQLGGGSYKFTYNAPDTPSQQITHGWGEVSGIELPSGAKVAYTYSMDGADGPGSLGQTKDILKNQVVTKTVTYDLEYDGNPVKDGAVEIWGYSAGTDSSSSSTPDGGVTQTWFASTEPDQWGGSLPWDTGLTYKTISPDGTMVENIWDRSLPTGCHGAATCPGSHQDNPYITTTFTSIKEGSSYALTAIKDFTYDMNGNVIEVREYDYVPYSSVPRTNGRPTGLPSNASTYLKRVTKTAFHNQTPPATNDQNASPTIFYNEFLYVYHSPQKLLDLPRSVEIQDASGTIKSRSDMEYDYINRAAQNTKAGNLTRTRMWDSTKLATITSQTTLTDSNSIKTQTEYNAYGMPLTTTDANGNVTQITYGSVAGPNGSVTDLYPTQTVSAYGTTAARTSAAVYDFYTGIGTTATDVDNNVSVVTEYDALGRPVKVKDAAGTALESWTRTEYNDAARRVIVRSDIETIGDGRKVAVQHFDQLGRVRLSRSLENASTEDPTNEQHGIKVQTRYGYHSGSPSSSNGEYTLVSNPYRAATTSATSSEPTMGWKVAFESKSGNLNTVEFFSGSSLPSLWGSNTNSTGKSEVVEDANATTTTDEAGKVRRTLVDGLGRLIHLDEPDSSGALGSLGSPNQRTSYSHDALGNLLQIVQGGQTRTFTYSSLSRLTSASNPESGTFQFGYDSNGNLTTKTDARNVTTSFIYDELNRAKQRDYSDATPDVTYTYDDSQVPFSKGKLTKVASSVSESRITGYDAQERVTASQQVTEGQTYSFGYTYNLADSLVTQTYPSGKIVEFDYDSSGDLARVGSSLGFTYAGSFSYAPHDELEQVRFGNHLWETKQFNSRQQITQIGVGYSATNTGVWKTNYEYGNWQGSTLDTTKNNGSLARQTITVPTIGAATGFTAIQTYTHDSLDRLKSATETIGSNQTWKQTVLYDRFGNRNFDTAGTTILSSESSVAKVANPEILASNNRFKQDQDNDSQDDYLYDPSGNLTRNALGHEFAFNAENLQTSATGSGLSMAYSYDGNNKRVKSYNAVTDQTTIFVHDAEGKLAAEYTINVPAPSVPVISYLTDDALGSVRVTTNSFAEVKARRDFLPFGEELYAGIAGRNTNQKYSSSTDDVRKKFATYQRDAETGLDFAQSRYYSPMHGRFTSPDEFKGGPDELFDFEEDASDNPTFYADLGNPQSLNKYQYGYNNPYKFNDPTGHCPPIIVMGVIAVACLTNPDYAVAPTGRETAEEMASYRSTGGSGALLDMLPGGRAASLARNILFRRAVKTTGTKTATRGATTASKRGIEAEKRVLKSEGLKKNTTKVSSKDGKSVPDAVTKTKIVEVKDSKRVSNTKQIRIQRDAARASGRRHVIITGTKTKVSRAAQKGSEIKRRDDLGPQ